MYRWTTAYVAHLKLAGADSVHLVTYWPLKLKEYRIGCTNSVPFYLLCTSWNRNYCTS